MKYYGRIKKIKITKKSNLKIMNLILHPHQITLERFKSFPWR